MYQPVYSSSFSNSRKNFLKRPRRSKVKRPSASEMSDHESTLADISTIYSTTCHIDKLPKQSTRFTSSSSEQWTYLSFTDNFS